MASNLVKKDKEGWIIHPDYHHVKLAPAQNPALIPDLQDYMIQADYGKKEILHFSGRKDWAPSDDFTRRKHNAGRFYWTLVLL